MFDFSKIANLIPPQGKVAFTITTGERGKLVVLFHPMYPEVKGLSGKEKELYDQARVPLVIKATPEELNEGLLSLIEQSHEEEGRLHRALSAKREAVGKAISEAEKGKEQREAGKEEKPSHPPDTESDSPKEKTGTSTEKEPSTFDLFG